MKRQVSGTPFSHGRHREAGACSALHLVCVGCCTPVWAGWALTDPGAAGYNLPPSGGLAWKLEQMQLCGYGVVWRYLITTLRCGNPFRLGEGRPRRQAEVPERYYICWTYGRVYCYWKIMRWEGPGRGRWGEWMIFGTQGQTKDSSAEKNCWCFLF